MANVKTLIAQLVNAKLEEIVEIWDEEMATEFPRKGVLEACYHYAGKQAIDNFDHSGQFPEDEATEEMPKQEKPQAAKPKTKEEFIAMTGAKLQQGGFNSLVVNFIENKKSDATLIHFFFPRAVYRQHQEKCFDYIKEILEGCARYENVVTLNSKDFGTGQSYYRVYVN